MASNFLKTLIAIALIVAVFVTIYAVDVFLQSTSLTYSEIVAEIDTHDIDTGNALNFFGDEISGNAVFETTQTMEHPPGKIIHH